jgi:hypothetical protein
MKMFLRIVLLLALCVNRALAPSAQEEAEFRTVDILIDSQGEALAAYQLDWTIASGNATIVGIEGGEHSAFREAPYYDPQAIQQERVIVAAFKVASANELPKGKTRVATIHLRTKAGAQCEYKFHKIEAATSDGRRILIEASAQERKV